MIPSFTLLTVHLTMRSVICTFLYETRAPLHLYDHRDETFSCSSISWISAGTPSNRERSVTRTKELVSRETLIVQRVHDTYDSSIDILIPLDYSVTKDCSLVYLRCNLIALVVSTAGSGT